MSVIPLSVSHTCNRLKAVLRNSTVMVEAKGRDPIRFPNALVLRPGISRDDMSRAILDMVTRFHRLDDNSQAVTFAGCLIEGHVREAHCDAELFEIVDVQPFAWRDDVTEREKLLTLAAIECALTGRAFTRARLDEIDGKPTQPVQATADEICQHNALCQPADALVEAAVNRVAALCWFSRDQMHTDGGSIAENAVVKERRRKKWDKRLTLIPALSDDALSRIAAATDLTAIRREFEAAGLWHVKLTA